MIITNTNDPTPDTEPWEPIACGYCGEIHHPYDTCAEEDAVIQANEFWTVCEFCGGNKQHLRDEIFGWETYCDCDLDGDYDYNGDDPDALSPDERLPENLVSEEVVIDTTVKPYQLTGEWVESD
jgi:hypothetical protein